MSKTLRIIPLGGVGEIGKNMTALEYHDDADVNDAIVVIDAGMMFPEAHMLGVDLVIPDISYLLENRDKVLGILITHGHEDHIGALPYILPRLNAPLYATRLTAGLIEVKLRFNKVRDATIQIISDRATFQLGPFTIETFHVSHSIPDGVGVAVTTPVGTIVHTGDFKFDPNPVDGVMTDFGKLAELGARGVLALLSDSTNADSPGHTPSEQVIADTFARVFALAEGRLIIATFASNISRIQQAIDAAARFNRKLCVIGRSMQDNVRMAVELGYLNADPQQFIRADQVNDYTSNQVAIICTGGQGEPTSALAKMANREHKQVTLRPGDTIILSASAIPGNEEMINKTLNNLFREGATVYYDRFLDVHVSGHASQEEEKWMINLVRPKFFIPVHGEYRHLVMHAHLAEELGYRRENIFIVENGDVIEFDQNARGRVLRQSVSAADVLVDGIGVGEIGSVVLRDRHQLAQDGFFIAALGINSQTGEIVFGPEIETRGFVYTPEAESMLEGAKQVIRETVAANARDIDWSATLKQVLSAYLYKLTRRRPMVIPVVTEL
ncbi:MAG: ribonuclease J [Chloroflexi bacterium UTCFX4]|jgi:ribonuclease J|nr:MAG: ribonuclease J [Chloroflexi bacterium UTCFX4]